MTQSAILCHHVTVGTEEDEWEESVGRGRVPPSQESVELMKGDVVLGGGSAELLVAFYHLTIRGH